MSNEQSKKVMNPYIKAPLVLGGICVVSALLLGGLNMAAQAYKKSQPAAAPKSIQALDPKASFVAVEGFEPYTDRGSNTKVTIEEAYQIQEGGKLTGYAYSVNCGKAVKSDITFTVAFKGEISESTVQDVQPFSAVATGMGDPGYADNAKALLDKIAAGDASMNDVSAVVTGGTKSQKFVLDGLQVARNLYLAHWTGGSIGEKDETLSAIQSFFEDAVSYEEEEAFKPLAFTYKDIADVRRTGHVTKRYAVTLEDGSIARAYVGDGKAQVSPYDPSELSAELMVGFKGDVEEGKEKDVQPKGYAVLSSDFSYSQWQDSYLPGVVDGSNDIDDSKAVNCGATVSAKVVRAMMVAMRDDYAKTVIAEKAANVVLDFQNIYGEAFDSYVKDEDFEAKSGSLETVTGTYSIDERYTITLTGGETVKAYKGSAASQFDAGGEDESMSTTIIAGFDASNAVKGVVVKKISGWNDWVEGYIPGIVDGSKDLDSLNDVSVGSTYSAKAVRELLIAMRADSAAPKE